MYAGFSQLYIAFKPSTVTVNEYNIDHFHIYIDKIKKLMCIYMLKLYEAKTEFFILGTLQQLNKATNIHVNIADKTFQSTNSVQNLGFYLDQQLNNNLHIW